MNWNQLNNNDKLLYMKLCIRNGITSLDLIKLAYNNGVTFEIQKQDTAKPIQTEKPKFFSNDSFSLKYLLAQLMALDIRNGNKKDTSINIDDIAKTYDKQHLHLSSDNSHVYSGDSEQNLLMYVSPYILEYNNNSLFLPGTALPSVLYYQFLNQHPLYQILKRDQDQYITEQSNNIYYEKGYDVIDKENIINELMENYVEDEKIKEILRFLAENGYYDERLKEKKWKSVRDLQRMLVKEGYLSSKRNKDGNYIEVDGIRANKTNEAYKKYLREKEIDGIIGRKTKEAYYKYKTDNFTGDYTKDVPTHGIDGCALWVTLKYESANGELSKQNGVFGNAWEMIKNVTDNGGKEIYNIYNDRAFDDVTNKILLKAVTEKTIKKNPLDYKKLLVGDIVGIYMPSSNMHSEALNGTTFNTHIGIVTGFYDDGTPKVEHNIHGHHCVDKADDISGSLYGKAVITAVARPKALARKAKKLHWKSKESLYHVDESYTNLITTDTQKQNLQNYLNGLAGAKDNIQKIFPDANIDDVEEIAIGILGRETGFMRDDVGRKFAIFKNNAGRFAKFYLKRWWDDVTFLDLTLAPISAVKDYEADEENRSTDLVKMKLSSLDYIAREILDIHSTEDLEDSTKAARAVLYYLAKNNDYLNRLKKEYPDLGITDQDVYNATTWSYNIGMKQLYTLGFDKDTGLSSPEELEKLRYLSGVNTRIPLTIDVTNFKHLGKPGELAFKALKSGEKYQPYISKTNEYIDNVVKKWKSNNDESFQDGGVIDTLYGQWQYPGRITRIPSNNITMKGVDYPVLGVSNTGDTKLMQPNLDYKFNGSFVTEYPMIYNNGGHLFGGEDNSKLQIDTEPTYIARTPKAAVVTAKRPAWQRGLTDYDWARARQYYTGKDGLITKKGIEFLKNVASERRTGRSLFMRDMDGIGAGLSNAAIGIIAAGAATIPLAVAAAAAPGILAAAPGVLSASTATARALLTPMNLARFIIGAAGGTAVDLAVRDASGYDEMVDYPVDEATANSPEYKRWHDLTSKKYHGYKGWGDVVSLSLMHANLSGGTPADEFVWDFTNPGYAISGPIEGGVRLAQNAAKEAAKVAPMAKAASKMIAQDFKSAANATKEVVKKGANATKHIAIEAGNRVFFPLRTAKNLRKKYEQEKKDIYALISDNRSKKSKYRGIAADIKYRGNPRYYYSYIPKSDKDPILFLSSPIDIRLPSRKDVFLGQFITRQEPIEIIDHNGNVVQGVNTVIKSKDGTSIVFDPNGSFSDDLLFTGNKGVPYLIDKMFYHVVKSENNPEFNEALKKEIEYVTTDNTIPVGSTRLISEGYIGGAPGDIELLTTRSKYPDVAREFRFNEQGVTRGNTGYRGNSKKVMIGTEGENENLDINTLDDNGTLIHQFESTVNPEKMPKIYSDNARRQSSIIFDLNGHPTSSADLQIPKEGGGYYTLDEYFLKLKQNDEAVTLNTIDNNFRSSKPKHVERAAIMIRNPKLVKEVRCAILHMYAQVEGAEPLSVHFPDINWNDVVTNKEFLKKINFYGDIDEVANNPDMMKNIADYWYLRKTIGARSVNYDPTRSSATLDEVMVATRSFDNGSASGGGGNYVLGNQFGGFTRNYTGYSQFHTTPLAKNPTLIDIINAQERESKIFNTKEFNDAIQKINLKYGLNIDASKGDLFTDELQDLVKARTITPLLADNYISDVAKELKISGFRGEQYSSDGDYFGGMTKASETPHSIRNIDNGNHNNPILGAEFGSDDVISKGGKNSLYLGEQVLYSDKAADKWVADYLKTFTGGVYKESPLGKLYGAYYDLSDIYELNPKTGSYSLKKNYNDINSLAAIPYETKANDLKAEGLKLQDAFSKASDNTTETTRKINKIRKRLDLAKAVSPIGAIFGVPTWMLFRNRKLHQIINKWIVEDKAYNELCGRIDMLENLSEFTPQLQQEYDNLNSQLKQLENKYILNYKNHKKEIEKLEFKYQEILKEHNEHHNYGHYNFDINYNYYKQLEDIKNEIFKLYGMTPVESSKFYKLGGRLFQNGGNLQNPNSAGSLIDMLHKTSTRRPYVSPNLYYLNTMPYNRVAY